MPQTNKETKNSRSLRKLVKQLKELHQFDITLTGDIEKIVENPQEWAEEFAESAIMKEVPSGVSMMIKDLERTEDYQDDLALWKMYEEDFYRVERNIVSSVGVSLPSDLGLDFKEPEYPKTVQDQILWDKHRLELNLIDEVGLLLEYNNDLTREQAELTIASNKQRNEKLSIFERARQAATATTPVRSGAAGQNNGLSR